ncbi:MAG: CoA transferase [Dehalococcoidia bacterium]|nr:CoA transferase [Dehalococcoidia bacterium]
MRPLTQTLQALGIRCTAVQDYAELANDPQVKANGYVVELEHPAFGSIRVPANPIRLGRTPTVTPVAAPKPGEHTLDVLAELSIEGDAVERLRSSGALGGKEMR